MRNTSVTSGKNVPAATVLLHAFAALAFAYSFLLGLDALAEYDLWWHLATGKWIVQNKSLPGHEDPFSYTTPPLSDSQVDGMRSQWLGQVAFYLVYVVGGYRGVALVRTLLIVLPFIWLYIRFARKGLHPLLALSCVSFPLFIIPLTLYNTFERPQVFSFLFTPVVFLLLSAIRRGKGAWAWVLPPVMAAWANLHGGYIVGIAVICAYAAGEAAALLLGRTRFRAHVTSPSHPAVFFAACAAGIAASALNPGGYALLPILFSKAKGLLGMAPGRAGAGTVMGEILEYKPLWVFSRDFHVPWPLYIMAFYAAGLISLLLKYAMSRKVDVSEALVSALLVYFGMWYARGVNFALVFLSLVAGEAVLRLKGMKRAAPAFAMACILAWTLAYVARTTLWELRPRVPEEWVSSSYPEEAVGFLREHDIRGPMFNSLEWGGYLIWRTYPQYRVFFDGREISSRIFGAYTGIMRTAPGWEETLDAFGVNFILVPVMSGLNGDITPLVLRMAKQRPAGWRVVYLRGNVVLLVRNTKENREAIECCEVSFPRIYWNIVDMANFLLVSKPGHPGVLLSKAVALYGLGMRNEAEDILSTLPPTPLREAYLRLLSE